MRRALCIAAVLLASSVQAQEDDRGFLTAFLEDNLSEAGRTVTILGFEGALSSRATISTLSIADDAGVWLTLTGVTLDWSRSSLLSGALEVTELSADTITVARLPDTGDGAMPSPEAVGFSLPELPVSVNIGEISAGRITLAPEVFGQAVEGSLSATLQLADGIGNATFDLVRSDAGPDGSIVLDASYDNTTRQLRFALDAGEGPGGIVSTLIGIPGAPATNLTLRSAGPLEAFEAEIALSTDGEERLAGTVAIGGQEDGSYRLRADVRGNLAPILVPEQVEFFGNDIGLVLDAQRSAVGRVTVDQFALQARAIAVSGRAVIAADGLPEEIAVSGTLATPDNEPVLLPFGATETRIDRADFSLEVNQAEGSGWTLSTVVAGLARADLAVERLALDGSGRIGRTPAGNTLGGAISFAAEGLAPTDPGLAEALGSALKGQLELQLLEGSGALSLSDIVLTGEDLRAGGSIRIEGLETGLLATGNLEAEAADLSRFALLAGRPLAGSGIIRVDGSASPLSGALDAAVEVVATDLRVGLDPVDRLLTGASSVALSVLRDETGTTLRSLDLTADALTASASGKLATEGSDLTANARLASLAVLGAGFGGEVSLDVRFTGTAEAGNIVVTGVGTGLRTGNGSADRLLQGQSRLSADVSLADGSIRVNAGQLANPQLSFSASGDLGAATRQLAIEARLADLGLLVPDIQGPLTLTGDVTDDGAGYRVNISGQGPGQVEARVSGELARDFGSADLSISGSGQAGLANIVLSPRAIDGRIGYDLRLAGPLRLTSLSGRVTLANGRLTDPNLGFALEGMEALATLQGGTAQVSATASPSTGGRIRVDGPVGLAAPFQSRLVVALERTRIFNPELYDTTVDGSVTIEGPLAGGALISGALTVPELNLRVPESGLGGGGSLLDVTHRGEPAGVRDTRIRAGLLRTVAAGGGTSAPRAPLRLDLSIFAPSRIFLRGRGIDAELGGEIRLLGTTAAVVPSGAFNLIRGRLDILGRRLVLERADLRLEGSFVPTLDVSASTRSDDATAFIEIEGPASDPIVTFRSIPDLPQEEVLAQLLFGRSIDSISPLQAAQLANAVAVLAGRGGEGLVNRLRRGFGLDDLDIATADDGSTALTAGKYLSENVYTEVEIGQAGTTRINLNLDLRPGVTVKGRVGADGETGIGIFVERDY